MTFRTLDDLDVQDKTVLVRADLNVPMEGGKVTDNTRIVRMLPTLNTLIKKKARVVLLSHFGRPEGKFVPSLSLAPLVDPISEALDGKEVQFGVDCIGPAAQEAVDKLRPGAVLLLENLRFHPEEEKGDTAFARALAALGDVFVNDAFSCSHRAHASITGIAATLPAAAGRLMEEELGMLEGIFAKASKPVAAIVGGSKVSSKLALLENLTSVVNVLVIGGAMANTFLYAEGYDVGESLVEKSLKATAKRILAHAEKKGCRIVLPVDVVVAKSLESRIGNKVVDIDHIPSWGIAADIGPASVKLFCEAVEHCKTVVWNGPLGAFETAPFDNGTIMLARYIALLTGKKKMRSIGGGGDTVAALAHAGLEDGFTYLSAAGGAFLEWLEGKKLPGVSALERSKVRRRA